jgi:microcystin-dependent protein
MAGTLFGLGLSPQFDANGDLARGALLYIYDANTSTPSSTYSDFALASVQAWPLPADAAGRLPAFYVDDGSYRARLTTSGGVEIFDEQSITSIGASAGDSGGGVAQDTTTLFNTGDPIWVPVAGTRSGWVRANGRTMGSGSSGGTERANSDTQALFEYLWNNFSDTICPVSTGRGANAAADFNSAKTITLLDLRGRAGLGLDDMGNSAASRLVAGTPTAAGSTGGAEKQTIAQANLPVATLVTTDTRTYQFTQRNTGSATEVGNADANEFVANDVNATATITMASPTTGTISTALGGSGTTLATTPPYMLGSWYLKL